MRSIRNARSAGAATVVSLSMPPEADVQEAPAISDGEFQRLVQRAEQGELTDSEFQQLRDDRERAARKRKTAVIAGHPVEAASASSRDQTITRGILVPYALSGVRAKPGRKKGGQVTGMKAQSQGEVTKAKVHEWATRLLPSHAPREVSGIIISNLHLSRPTVLKHLRDHPSGHWSKKR